MSVTITELTPGFVGEVSGLDITQPLTRAQVAELEAGMDRLRRAGLPRSAFHR